jgi:N-acetylglucosamine kinase-like BadF-type ATPase
MAQREPTRSANASTTTRKALHQQVLSAAQSLHLDITLLNPHISTSIIRIAGKRKDLEVIALILNAIFSQQIGCKVSGMCLNTVSMASDARIVKAMAIRSKNGIVALTNTGSIISAIIDESRLATYISLQLGGVDLKNSNI